MSRASHKSEFPSYYDGTQLVISVILPDKTVTIADVYDHVYGMYLDDGAKPWPYYRDADSGEWWSLNTKTDVVLDALAWMLPLDQLKYKPRHDAKAFLEQVYFDLEAAAGRFGARAVPESSVADALNKMDCVEKISAIRDYAITILVCGPEGCSYNVAEWSRACEAAGLHYGDGNLFWRLNEAAPENPTEPDEYFAVEPYTQPGYFHHDDLHSSFPDVALSFRVRDFLDPQTVLRKMASTAASLAAHLDARVLSPSGKAFELPAAENELRAALKKLRTLQAS